MGNIKDCYLCIHTYEYVDLEKDEIITEKNSESRKKN